MLNLKRILTSYFILSLINLNFQVYFMDLSPCSFLKFCIHNFPTYREFSLQKFNLIFREIYAVF